MAYYFSEKECGFYCKGVNDDIPEDALEISDELYYSLLKGQSSGMVIAADDKGYPVLTAQPEPTKDELVAGARAQKSALMAAVNEAVVPLEDAVDLGMATDEEKRRLLILKKYRVLLNRVDVEEAPEIKWPELPDDVA